MQARCRKSRASPVFPAVLSRIFLAFRCAKAGAILESVQYGPACGILHKGT